MRKLAVAFIFLIASVVPGLAQSACQYIAYGAVLTPAQWNFCFQQKADTVVGGYLPLQGGTMVGALVTAPSAAVGAGFSLPPGVAPTSPQNGNMWTTAAGLFVQVNGATVGPLAEGTTGSFAATEPITVSAAAGVVTYGFDYAHAGTFAAIQTDNGLTTTSPGWYAGITGDTVSRVRVGLNSTDVPSIAFGPGGASARDLFLERVGPGNLRFGAPDAASPVPQTLSVQNVVAGTSNAAGANLTVALSQGTGSAAGGGLVVEASAAGGSGTSVNPLAAVLDYGVTTPGAWTFAKPAAFSASLTMPDSSTWTPSGGLSGTVINNTIIGNATAAAGTFTTVRAATLGSVSAVAYGFNSAKTGFYSGTQDASVGLSVNGSDVLDYGVTTAATLTHLKPTVVSGASFGLSGNISGGGIIGTSGIRYKNAAATLTDTSSSGTIAAAYTDLWGGDTIAASGATTVTNYYGSYFQAPVAGANVTLTNKWALGADSLSVGTSNPLTVSAAGAVVAAGAANVVGALTLGAQQTTQGSVVLANAAAGAFAATLESSNSATAAYTLVLPTSLHGSGPVILTDALGNGVLSWSSPSAASSVGVGSTGVTSGTTNQILFDNGGTLGEVTKGNNCVYLTNGSGAPSCGNTIGAGVTLDGNLTFSPTTDGIVGTTTNDNAGTGNVGEFQTSYIASGSAVSLSTGTPKTITSIALTAGDWDVRAVGCIDPAGTTTISQIIVGISTSNNAFSSTTGQEGVSDSNTTFATGQIDCSPTGAARYSLSGTTTIYMVMQSAFAVSTNAGFGTLSARRVR